MVRFTRFFLLALLLLIAQRITAQATTSRFKLPDLFASHMVLQQQKPIPVWGWTKPGEKVTVTMAGQTQTTKADKLGRWQVNLNPVTAGGPYTLTASGKSGSATLDDVLVGEVWLCSGQSNMEWPLSAAKDGKAEAATANYPTIRQFYVPHVTATEPQSAVAGQWSVCSPQTAGKFTAVGYFFARDLQKTLNVPIGLVHSSWGGTHSETWTSREAIASDAALRPSLDGIGKDGETAVEKAKALTNLIEKLQGTIPAPAEATTYRQTVIADGAWPTMQLPVLFDPKLGDMDGVVWFRKTITIPGNADLKDVTINLGAIDDYDSTFVNGQFVGAVQAYNEPRKYTIPAGVLKPGSNVIAIRLVDTGGGGGFMAKAEEMILTGSNWSVPLAGDWHYKVAQIFPSSTEKGPNAHPTLLFNAMLKPLVPYALRGVIWYQGESNAGRAKQYRTSFPLMITDWRKQWGEDFPFLFVQLANFNSGGGNSQKGSSWAELREAQTMALSLPNTGMAVTSDIGNPTDIHPTNKLDVGKRLAAEARRVAYKQAITSAGPQYKSLAVNGNEAILTFNSVGAGLTTPNKYGYLMGFEVAGNDGQFHYARAEIRGDSVIVKADSVAKPVAVRYGWADDNGEVNLYNKDGFPAVPFRTDTWEMVTEGKGFLIHE
ncbi:beta galactosidase jelly roll domain-containing protein [Fibrella sp. HMF5335]|uniref:Beta galactosidase jelly roll domain-containing protein n=1 Tax=Fibrella rubiginis TaxID=2817060 RepID=A0A939GHE3_9BACT|nr:sialate O-acetylesterase [Fibrella rubiginis]MBO0936816.1 beta galactosidase jelly roll domain-containing protein [Fibrella rubiginis]